MTRVAAGTNVILFAVAAAIACGLGACSTSPSTAPSTAPADGAVDSVHIGSATLGEIKASGSAFQAGLASDGVLTFAEYDQLVHAYLQCVEAGGAEVSDLMLTVAHTYYFTVGTPPNYDTGFIPGCNAKYWHPLAELWSSHQSIPPALAREADDALGECLRGRGVDFPFEHPTSVDFQSLMKPGSPTASVRFECQQQIDRQFKFPLTWAG